MKRTIVITMTATCTEEVDEGLYGEATDEEIIAAERENINEDPKEYFAFCQTFDLQVDVIRDPEQAVLPIFEDGEKPA